ncbi:hypothetical protein AAVH_01927 [Aphelenchoides avenae]|nr:hypothetical protein AAVH_42467 [Aphelenchus avenae]KAH7730878.1 hypothetical protein AAVH_01927 [Aphelenchus avenae]
MTKRGVQPDLETTLTKIYASEFAGYESMSDSLMSSALAKYPESDAMIRAAAVQGAAAADNITRLQQLLTASLVKVQPRTLPKGVWNGNAKERKYMLKLPQDALFNVIWLLSKNDPSGQKAAKWTSEV